ncbi:hypothetical protein [Sinomonas sp. P47F7]|uniref:hypothetical protein n=1 Tax=Sinomonas sp. P47F7 TaxID=3410987 RepID=UPI003BF4FACD
MAGLPAAEGAGCGLGAGRTASRATTGAGTSGRPRKSPANSGIMRAKSVDATRTAPPTKPTTAPGLGVVTTKRKK